MNVSMIPYGNANGLVLVQATLNPASVAAATSAEQTFTVTGVRVNDFVLVSKPTVTAGLGIVNARVSAANTVAITFMNATAGALDAGSEVYTFLVFRPDSTPLPTVVS